MKDEFVIGLAGSPFGLDGRIKIHSLSGFTGHLLGMKNAAVRVGGTTTVYKVEAAFSAPLSIKLAGVDSPEAARALKGAEILADRAGAAPLESGEFYIEDLKGLAVFSGGEQAGVIGDVIEGGGGFLVEIVRGSGKKCLVPFRNEFFGRLDIEAGTAELLAPWILDDVI
ncbi:MAG: ribosome maturation factor RimM [Treponema sp.]|jgi:16S rRNA processing protein RimM|nr:ribosome maturation factor RimM [Treponema sp.]